MSIGLEFVKKIDINWENKIKTLDKISLKPEGHEEFFDENEHDKNIDDMTAYKNRNNSVLSDRQEFFWDYFIDFY